MTMNMKMNFRDKFERIQNIIDDYCNEYLGVYKGYSINFEEKIISILYFDVSKIKFFNSSNDTNHPIDIKDIKFDDLTEYFNDRVKTGCITQRFIITYDEFMNDNV